MKENKKVYKYIFSFLGVILAYFTLYNPAFAYSENFDDMTLGTLGTQGGFSATSSVNVVDDKSVSNPNSINFNYANDTTTKTFSGFTSSDNTISFNYYLTKQASLTNSCALLLRIRVKDTTDTHTSLVYTGIPADHATDGNLYTNAGANCATYGTQVATTMTEGNWYFIEYNFDFNNNTYKARINNGAWSSDTIIGDTQYTWNDIRDVYFNIGGTGTLEYNIDDLFVGQIAPTCTDGIQNQNETGIDVGGICFYVALIWPENATQVPDFAQWTTKYYGNDATPESPSMQMGVQWSDDLLLLNDCLNFPTPPADYEKCFGSSPHINIDYGTPQWSSFADLSENINKTGTMIANKTYYARAVLWSTTGTQNTRDTLLSYGDLIAFSIDNTGGASTCPLGDIPCYIRASLQWAFIPSQETLTQFSEFQGLLSSKAPFGYVKQIYDALTTITYNADSEIVVLEEVQPINDLIFTPIRTGLTWILYFVFMFMLFKRFRDIQI